MVSKTQTGVGERLIFTCAGASHVGQVANRTGLRLMGEGVGKLFCVAAVAARCDDKVKRARRAGERIAIDGSEEECCLKIIQEKGIPVDVHVVATELGVEKQPDKPHLLDDARRLANRVKQALLRI